MKRAFYAIIVIALLLAACSSAPSDSSVQTAIARTQGARSNAGQPTQPNPSAAKTNTPAAGGNSASASVAFQLYNLVKVATENGWNFYSARFAVKNLTNQFLYVTSSKPSDSKLFVPYQTPAAGVVVETAEGNKYPAMMAGGDCKVAPKELVGSLYAFYLPPNSTITRYNLGGDYGCLTLTFKVPETMKPARLVVFNSATTTTTLDLTAVPASINISNPNGTLSLPTTLKSEPFEITIQQPPTVKAQDGWVIASYKVTIKNTNLAGDMKWPQLDRVLTMSKDGNLDVFSGGVNTPKDTINYEYIIGPGQTKSATIYQFFRESSFIPGARTLYFYTGSTWAAIQVNVPAP